MRRAFGRVGTLPGGEVSGTNRCVADPSWNAFARQRLAVALPEFTS
ncbi:MAG: hypothetical protein JNN08_10615 [Bryobacterales bacterium]|nr:hypothetical protein [Bryobacterales bacterium]